MTKRAIDFGRTMDFWKSPQTDAAAYTQIKDDRTKQLVQSFDDFDRGLSVLELGCGPGRNLEGLRKAGFTNLHGIDINTFAIDLIPKTYPELTRMLKSRTGPLEEILPRLEAKSYDIVFTMAVLLHIHPTSEWIFRHIARITSKYLVTIEHENYGCYSWCYSRNYKTIFEGLGFRQYKELSWGNACQLQDGNGPYIGRFFEALSVPVKHPGRFHNPRAVLPPDERELLNNLDKFPKMNCACIVGSGPSALGRLALVPIHMPLIAVNSAILHNLPFNYWMLFDENAPRYEWFKSAVPKGCTVMMGRTIADERVNFTFTVRRRMNYTNVCSRGEFLNGATVVGVACQWLHMIGVREIMLFGCEFNGPANFDGSSAGGQGARWRQASWFERMARVLEARGTRIVSRLPTALNIPVVGDT